MSTFRIVKTECNTACSGCGSSCILNEIDLKCILNSIITLNNGGNINKLGNNMDGDNENERYGYSVSLNEDGSVVSIGTPSFDIITSRDKMGFDSYGGADATERNQWGYTAIDGKLVYNQGTDNQGLTNIQASEAFPVGSYFEYVYVDTIFVYRGRMKVLENDGNGNLIVDNKLEIDIESDGRNDFSRIEDAGFGRTQVYKWNDTKWVKMGNDIVGEFKGDWSGFSVSLNGNGSIVAIGAPINNTIVSGKSSGHTRIYQWNNTNWVQMGNDIDGKNDSDDKFGFSVSLSRDGSKVAIGAINNNTIGTMSGLTQIYEWNGTDWVQMGTDIFGDLSTSSGSSVSLNGDGSMVAIGAVGNENIPRNTRIYKWNDTDWVQMGNDITGYKGNPVGYSVSLSRDRSIVAIGSIFNSDYIGHTRIYEWNDTDWVQMGDDIFGETDRDLSGYSVSLSDNGLMLAIGAILNSSNGTHSGNTRIYQWNNVNWVQIGADIDGETDGNWSGYSVSLSGNGSRVAIGAPGHVFDIMGGDYEDTTGYTRVYKTINCITDILDRL